MQTIAEWTRASGFPTFAPLFERVIGVSVSPYLSRLSLYPQGDSRVAVLAVRRAVAESPAPTSEIVALLADSDWRPQLIGAGAILTGVRDSETLHALWEALDHGSWASPQLAATAFICDPAFERHARSRIMAGCPINTEMLGGVDSATHHSEESPISSAVHSGKTLASLVGMCRRLPSGARWLENLIAGEDVREIFQGSTDGGEQIAPGWYEGIRPILETRQTEHVQ